MPFAGFETFDQCVSVQRRKGHSVESARKICGAIKARVEGKKKPASSETSKKKSD